MNLKLNKPLCFFDLETTGTQVASDRIVEIAILKVFPNGNKEMKSWYVNPGMPIPAEATAIHGITDQKVAAEPVFAAIAKTVYAFIKDSDLAGFNSDRFDIPLLAEEMLRAGVDFDMKSKRTVDVQTIFHKMEKRNLEAAYAFYCGKSLDNAHSAIADAEATFNVLLAQVERYDDLGDDVASLSDFSTRRRCADFAGFIGLDEEEQPYFTFGKHKGTKVADILENEPGYFGWLLNADFPLYTKKVLTQIKLNKINTKNP